MSDDNSDNINNGIYNQENSVFILLASGVNKLTKPQLTSELTKRGLITTGLVPELKDRLLKYLNEESFATDFFPFDKQNFAPIINQGKINIMDSKKPYFKPGTFSDLASENIDSFLKKYNRAASINGWTEEERSQ